ncbi:MAG: YhcH/YjgK/YiaL family protein [Opitutales bacterium]
MAIFGPFATVRDQLAGDARFGAAFAYLAEMLEPGSAGYRRLLSRPEGASEKMELTGGAFGIEQVYQTRARAECFFESHRRYIDVQVIVGGVELMEVADLGRLTETQPYDAERDYVKYADPGDASCLRVQAGDLAVFFPADGHMPCLQAAGRPSRVHKTVVKVPLL